MTALPSFSGITETEYLEFERAAEMKHEFVNGEILAMSGAGRNHSLISVSASATLLAQLRGKGCSVFSNDMRVRAPILGNYTYPDITLVCGKPEYTDDQFDTLANPTVVVEILSPSTEAFDRNEKFRNYWHIPSLKAYVLMAQDQARIEHFTRQSSTEWLLTVAEGLESSIALPSIDCILALSDVYGQVTFESDENISESE